MITEYVSGHRCIDCLAADPTSTNKPPRKLATAEGQPPRCATHLREVTVRRKKQARARQVERTYNISAEDNHALFMLQGGKCWLCRKATGAAKSLAVDHDHATDEVRGRLCGPCNQFIGRLRDDPEAAQRLVSYLTGDTPYRRLKAQQTLTQAVPPAAHRPDAGDIVVLQVIEDSSGQIYADWKYGDRLDSLSYRTVVRNSDGTWLVTRE